LKKRDRRDKHCKQSEEARSHGVSLVFGWRGANLKRRRTREVSRGDCRVLEGEAGEDRIRGFLGLGKGGKF
jgi:hypothetical protein